jgi:proteasome lid subunit RPN8/RPN11
MTLLKPWVSPEIVDQVLRIGQAEEPFEACGVVTPDSKVLQLPNCSPTPSTSFVIDPEDLVNILEEWLDSSGTNPEDLEREHFIIWHTHPGGVVGPSKGDLRHKIPGFKYLVVTMPSGIATIF